MQDDDAIRRLLVEARNKAEGLFYSSDKAMEEFGNMLDPVERENLLMELNDCRAAIAQDDLAVVEDAVARLEVTATRIGEMIYAAADSSGGDIGGGM
jgi:molecular chaperone DnaK